jgi:hypothetical protein
VSAAWGRQSTGQQPSAEKHLLDHGTPKNGIGGTRKHPKHSSQDCALSVHERPPKPSEQTQQKRSVLLIILGLVVSACMASRIETGS